jgi:hypothetical protein
MSSEPAGTLTEAFENLRNLAPTWLSQAFSAVSMAADPAQKFTFETSTATFLATRQVIGSTLTVVLWCKNPDNTVEPTRVAELKITLLPSGRGLVSGDKYGLGAVDLTNLDPDPEFKTLVANFLKGCEVRPHLVDRLESA